MIPVLFAPNETSFLSNGLGTLSDAISCIVTEERNGEYTLEMVYPVDGIHFSEIQHSSLIEVVPSDGATEQLFRVYKITKPMNGRVTIYAEHISYQLTHIPVYPFTAPNVVSALQGLTTYAAETCPFTFWTDKTTVANYSQVIPESIRARLGGQQGSILDVYGGEYEWDNYTIKLHGHRGANRGVTLRYGKNITDLQQEENIENTYTGVLPYWADAEGGNAVYAAPVYSDNAGNFPYKRTKTVDFSASFENQPTAAQLTARAQAYILANNIGIPKVSIKVSFVALWQTEEYKNIANLERVKLCDTLTIQFEKLGISATAKVIKTVYDVLKERYREIEVGEAKSSLSERIVEQEQAIQEAPDIGMMQRAIENATAQITGAKGGHVRFVYDGNDEPTELLIMNTADISTATKIWRWNLGGLGYSKTGYAGSYGTAITQDGAIVADFITAGTMNANLIRAGLLTDVAGKNYWNMVTGELKLSASTAVGDSTIATQANVAVNADAISAEVTRATTAEGTLSAAITANANAITLKVSKGDVSSEISQEAGQITISSNRFVLNSTNCSISADGKITASNVDLTGKITASSGSIGGFTIDSTKIYNGKSTLTSNTAGVYIGTDGISLGSGSTFKVTNSGELTATSGSVGGFTIDSTKIYNGKSTLTSNTAGVYIGTDGISLGTGSTFKVTKSGALTASDAEISGKITASSGSIGGFTIDSTKIYNGKSTLTANAAGVYIGTDGISLGTGSTFKVTNSGELTATSGTIGNFTVSSSGLVGTTNYGTTKVSMTTEELRFSNTYIQANKAHFAKYSGTNLSFYSEIAGDEITLYQTYSVNCKISGSGINLASGAFTVKDSSNYVYLDFEPGSKMVKLGGSSNVDVSVGSANGKISFFGNATTAAKQSVSSVSGSTVNDVKTGLNNLIAALKAYSLIA